MQNDISYENSIVGNIIDRHIWGQEKRIQRGTKHFRPGTKVYCIFEFGGNGHEHIRVMGKPRKSSRLIDVVISTSLIKKFRMQKVYDPKIISFIKKHGGPSAEYMAQWGFDGLNKTNAENCSLPKSYFLLCYTFN